MSVAIVFLEARPGADAAVAHLLTELVAPTAREPGTVSYVVHRDPARPTRFAVYERYADAAALDAHMAAPWLQAAVAALADQLAAPPEIHRFTPVAAFDRAGREPAR